MKKTRVWSLLWLGLFTANCGKDPQQAIVPLSHAPDVLRVAPSRATALVARVDVYDEAACRERMRHIACVQSVTEEDTECQPGSPVYGERLVALYEQFPPVLQRTMCSLNRLIVAPEFFATAAAGLDTDEDHNLHGAVMLVRKAFIDEPLSTAAWATWKEQLNFGGAVDPAKGANSALPTVSVQGGAPDMLTFIVAHELGHFLDFANGLNAQELTTNPDGSPAFDRFVPGSWGALSWEGDEFVEAPTGGFFDNSVPLPEADFPLRSNLCFYGCNGHAIPVEQAPVFYRGLDASPFISAYAASNPSDDFADTLAYLIWEQLPRARYGIHLEETPLYDALKKAHAPQFAAKRAFVEAFLARQDIVYPAP